jgi:hypothetical protein
MNNLSIVGGTSNLVDSIVESIPRSRAMSTRSTKAIIRAGELAQRQATGPTYLSVSTETLMAGWTPPANPRFPPRRAI